MSVRRAFEKLGTPKAVSPEAFVYLRQAEGQAHEHSVSIALYERTSKISQEVLGHYSISVHLRKIDSEVSLPPIISSDFQKFDRLEDAEDRFNALVKEYGLTEEPAKTESAP